MNNKSAVVLGGSGLVGSFLLPLLAESDRYTVVYALVRKRLDINLPKVQQIVVDFDRQDQWSSLFSVKPDDVFCCLGTTQKIAGGQQPFYKVDHDHVVNSAKTLAACGAEQFLTVSAYGASKKSSSFYMRTKAETEADLKSLVGDLGFKSLHIFKPSLLTGPRGERRGEHRLNEELGGAAMRLVNPLLRGKLARSRSVPASFVAQHMLSTAKQERDGIHDHFPSQAQLQKP